MFGFVLQLSLEAIIGVLISLPADCRLSEEVIGAAVLQFYKTHHKQPLGLALEVLEQWAAKQAFGLRGCCSKFKVLLRQSKHGAKSKAIRDAKTKFWELAPAAQEPSAQEPSNPLEALQECGAFDWVRLEAALKEAVKGVARPLKTEKMTKSTSFESTSSVKSDELRRDNKYLLPLCVFAPVDGAKVLMGVLFVEHSPAKKSILSQVSKALEQKEFPPPVAVEPQAEKEADSLQTDELEADQSKKRRKSRRMSQRRRPRPVRRMKKERKEKLRRLLNHCSHSHQQRLKVVTVLTRQEISRRSWQLL